MSAAQESQSILAARGGGAGCLLLLPGVKGAAFYCVLGQYQSGMVRGISRLRPAASCAASPGFVRLNAARASSP